MITRRFAIVVVAAVFAVLFSPANLHAQAPGAPPKHGQVTDAQKEEARSHFDLGVSHFDREEWQAALVEFLKSRDILPTKGNSKNAAICLRKVGRFDEALDMFEALLRDFADVSPTDRALAEREIAELQASVGTVQVVDAPAGATVSIDSVERGKTPLRGPVRLSAGSHTVRVTKEGSLPFEARVDLAGKQAAVVHARLAELTQAGRLRVSEREGKKVDVIVDGAVVGTTPWEGALAPGPHTLQSRGEGTLGTQPEQVAIQLDHVTTVELIAAQLRATLRVDANHSGATIAIDDVPVGHGSWEGRLRSGKHRVAISFEGYLPFARDVVLADDAREVVTAALVPPASAEARVAFELDPGAALGLSWGGDLYGGCTGACAAGFPLGGQGEFHAIYETPSGLGFGVHAGYLLLHAALDGRPESVTPVGKNHDTGTASDTLLLSGLTVGGDAQYATGGDWPVTLRLGIGALVGSIKDSRSGTFTDTKNAAFTASANQSSAADYLYAAPEARLGRKLGDHFEINAGVQALILNALKTPVWSPNASQVLAGADGEGVFGAANLTGGVMLVLTPGIGLKFEL